MLPALSSTANRTELVEQLLVSVNTSQLRLLDVTNLDEALARATAPDRPASDESSRGGDEGE